MVEYEVEAIVDHSTKKKNFQVKWKGYPESDNTWEPLENVADCIQFQQYLETLHPTQRKDIEEALDDLRREKKTNSVKQNTKTPRKKRISQGGKTPKESPRKESNKKRKAGTIRKNISAPVE